MVTKYTKHASGWDMWGYVQLNKQNDYFGRAPERLALGLYDAPYYLRSGGELSYLKSRRDYSFQEKIIFKYLNGHWVKYIHHKNYLAIYIAMKMTQPESHKEIRRK